MNGERSAIEKYEAIIRAIRDICNADDDGNTVTFTRDWGGNGLTVLINGSHTHVGDADAEFQDLVDGLYRTLTGGPGLSWVPATPKEVIKET